MRARNNLAFTLIEALIVIAIIGIMSVFYVVNLRPNTTELLKMDTTRLAADIRYVRSMAASRAMYDGAYPGGYGIYFENGNGTDINSKYILFAGEFYNPSNPNPTNVLKTVTLSNVAFRLLDPNAATGGNNTAANRTFIFLSENAVRADNFVASSDGDYQVEIYYPVDEVNYSKSRINIGRKTSDDFVWSNLAITYDVRNIECGNGIQETGEDCEPAFNPECTPDCHINVCGDGFLFGVEQCEMNNNDPAPVLCPEPYPSWCAVCFSDLPNLDSECKTVDGPDEGSADDLISCCPSQTVGTCINCNWQAAGKCMVECISP